MNKVEIAKLKTTLQNSLNARYHNEVYELNLVDGQEDDFILDFGDLAADGEESEDLVELQEYIHKTLEKLRENKTYETIIPHWEYYFDSGYIRIFYNPEEAGI